jgi:TatD DNase family protein
MRGRRNEPAFVVHTAAAVAAVKDIAVDELAAVTWSTTNRFYGLPE